MPRATSHRLCDAGRQATRRRDEDRDGAPAHSSAGPSRGRLHDRGRRHSPGLSPSSSTASGHDRDDPGRIVTTISTCAISPSTLTSVTTPSEAVAGADRPPLPSPRGGRSRTRRRAAGCRVALRLDPPCAVPAAQRVEADPERLRPRSRCRTPSASGSAYAASPSRPSAVDRVGTGKAALCAAVRLPAEEAQMLRLARCDPGERRISAATGPPRRLRDTSRATRSRARAEPRDRAARGKRPARIPKSKSPAAVAGTWPAPVRILATEARCSCSFERARESASWPGAANRFAFSAWS